jgi:hypothetical protein
MIEKEKEKRISYMPIQCPITRIPRLSRTEKHRDIYG